jgi:hypothetical protein
MGIMSLPVVDEKSETFLSHEIKTDKGFCEAKVFSSRIKKTESFGINYLKISQKDHKNLLTIRYRYIT